MILPLKLCTFHLRYFTNKTFVICSGKTIIDSVIGSKYWSYKGSSGDQFHKLPTCLSLREIMDWLKDIFTSTLESILQMRTWVHLSINIFSIGYMRAVCYLWVGGGHLNPHLKVYVLINCKADTSLIGYILFKWHTLWGKKSCFSAVKLVCWCSAKWKPYHSKYISFIHFYFLEEIVLCDIHMFIHFLVAATWTK